MSKNKTTEPLDREAQWTIYVCEECHQPHGDPRRFCRHEPHGVLSRLPADYRALRKVRVVHKTALLAAEQRAEEAGRDLARAERLLEWYSSQLGQANDALDRRGQAG